jgi:hypothetical protein
MVRWEYFMVPADYHMDHNSLYQLGQDGWELVGFDPHGNAWLKRPVRPGVS